MGETKTLSTRVSTSFLELIEKYLDRDTHLNPSDFLRDAAREKIRRDAPELYSSMFKEK